jgi:glyoxylase-like metal-dependent hydrolase (beta-lactamase superfamily II)
MKLHFPVSATVTARRWLVDARAGWAKAAFPIRYGILERADGLVLIDTGYSPELFAASDFGLRLYRRLLRPKLDPAQDAVAMVERLGAKAADIRDIVVTHLHADHVCGLGRFPNARLHMSRASLSLWSSPPSRKDLAIAFYRSLMPPLDAARVRVVEDAPSVPLPWGGEGHDIFGDGLVISVDLPGHMDGHFGLFFPQREKPLLYAVDADWTLAPVLSGREPNWPARLIVHDREAARQSAAVVRAAAEWGAAILLAHDPKPWPSHEPMA